MKAVLEFDLDDIDDRNAHHRALSATDAFIAFHKIDNMLRDFTKYEMKIKEGDSRALPEGYHTLTQKESVLLHSLAEEIRHKVLTILDMNNINMDYLE